jgi:hypothetical protein
LKSQGESKMTIRIIFMADINSKYTSHLHIAGNQQQ